MYVKSDPLFSEMKTNLVMRITLIHLENYYEKLMEMKTNLPSTVKIDPL